MKRHILLADDEPRTIRFMQKALERKGHTTDSAKDGKEALAKIRENRPDVLVSDVMMPEMDGFELLETVRRDPALMDLPVIMLTARPADFGYDDAARMKEWFADTNTDGYITKPFTPEILVKAVEHVLRSAQTASPISDRKDTTE